MLINLTVPDHVQFITDMAAAGLQTRLYHGRFCWHGPAVKVDTIQDALSNTSVRCHWDNLGLGYIVYPLHSDPGLAQD